jgi:A/G-specific adenine glycosylase
MWTKLIKWSKDEFSHLPWRKKRSLYRTLVSEIMLQQTTVGTVLNHFEKFLEKFPDLSSLAEASQEEVCHAWQGLGYYRRARNLHKASRELIDNHKGRFPRSRDELKSISGIGDYTANALIAMGRNDEALAVDANLERVLSRIYYIDEIKGPKLIRKITELFEQGKLVKNMGKWGSRSLNEALMDLGRVYCQAKKVNCVICPLKRDCLSFKKGKPLNFPRTLDKKVEKYELKLLRVLVKRGKKVLAYEKGGSEWLSGQLEIPTFVLKTDDPGLKQYPFLKKEPTLTGLAMIKTSITKYRIQNYILEMTPKEFQLFTDDVKYKYFNLDIQRYHFSSTTLKSLRKVLGDNHV